MWGFIELLQVIRAQRKCSINVCYSDEDHDYNYWQALSFYPCILIIPVNRPHSFSMFLILKENSFHMVAGIEGITIDSLGFFNLKLL